MNENEANDHSSLLPVLSLTGTTSAAACVRASLCTYEA